MTVVSQRVSTVTAPSPEITRGEQAFSLPRPTREGALEWTPTPILTVCLLGHSPSHPCCCPELGKGETSEARRMQSLRRRPSPSGTRRTLARPVGWVPPSIFAPTHPLPVLGCPTDLLCPSVRPSVCPTHSHRCTRLRVGGRGRLSNRSVSRAGGLWCWDAKQPVPMTRPLGSLSRDQTPQAPPLVPAPPPKRDCELGSNGKLIRQLC